MKLAVVSIAYILLIPVHAFSTPLSVISAAAAAGARRAFAEKSGLPIEGFFNLSFAIKEELFEKESSRGQLDLIAALCADSGNCSNELLILSMKSKYASGDVAFSDLDTAAFDLSDADQDPNRLRFVVKVVSREHWYSKGHTVMVYYGPTLEQLKKTQFNLSERQLAGPDKSEGPMAKVRLAN